MILNVIVGLSVVFQLVAAAVALRLMRTTGRQVAWGLMASGLSFIALRRVLAMIEGVAGSAPLVSDPVYICFGLLISGVFCAGVMRMSPFFSSVQKTASALRDAEDTIRQSEDRYSKVLSASSFGISVTGLEDGLFIDVNDAFLSIHGYSREEVIGKSSSGLNIWVDPERRRALVDLVRADQKHRDLEIRIRKKSGEIRTVLFTAELIRVDGKECILGLTHDATERKRAEKELVNLRKAVDASGQIIFMTDRDGVFTFVNPAFTELYGFAGEEIVGKFTPRILKGGSMDPAEYKRFWRHILGKERLRREMINRTRAGRPVIIENSVNPVLDDRGEITGFLSIQKDITEQRRLKEELEESADRFRQLTESIREVFWIRDTVMNKMIYVSPAYEAIWGRTVESLLGSALAWADAVHPDDRERVMEAARTQQLGGTYDQEFRITRPSGDIRWIRARAFPVRSGASDIRRVVGVAEDITERKQAEIVRESLEAQLQQAQRLESLGTLASGIAHDFNNILAIIEGHAALLGTIKSDPVRVSRSAGVLQKACERGTSVVKQLLMLARKTDPELEPIVVADMIADIARLLTETFPRDIVIMSSVSWDLPAVLVDATQIHQVLLNLCVNARDAMPQGGTLTIAASSVRHETVASSHPECLPGEYVMIEVKDSGHGMNEETKRRIFEPFFTTKAPGKGTGLGLSLVFSIVRSHQGWVDVKTSPGDGTTFTVFLPASEGYVVAAESAQDGGVAVSGGSETVLLIEDEELLRDLVTSIFEERGYRVIVASDGEEGVSAYKAHRNQINIVVTDVGLPKFSGEEVFRRIRAIDPSALVVLVSGFVEPGTKEDLLAAGAMGIIQKPFSPPDLLRTVRSILDGKRETPRS